MKLPKSEPTYYIKSDCPDCGHERLTVWDMTPVEGEDDLFKRRCLCQMCGCWFEETVRIVFQDSNITRTLPNGDEIHQTGDKHMDVCPFCGKMVDQEEDPYFFSEDGEESEYRRSQDLEEGVYPRVYYCLDCHAEIAELYNIVRVGTEITRHGMGDDESDCCPNCGGETKNYTYTSDDDSRFSLVCECPECLCQYLLTTEEAYNQTRIITDRDGWYADEDYSSLLPEKVAGDGDLCPMCEMGEVVAEKGLTPPESLSWRGLRGWRSEFCECRSCFTIYEDHYATRVVSIEVVKKGEPVV